MSQQLNSEEQSVCEFCDKKFIRKTAILAHNCPRKIRWLDKDTPASIIAFNAYIVFNKIHYPNKAPDVREFHTNKLYNEFANFGRWCIENAVCNPTGYINYIFKNAIKVTEWCEERTLKRFIKHWLINENPHYAVERTMKFISKWCEENDGDLDDFFKQVSVHRFAYLLRTGRISPWMLFVSDIAEEMLSRFDDIQLEYVLHLLDARVWTINCNKYRHELKELRDIMKEVGL